MSTTTEPTLPPPLTDPTEISQLDDSLLFPSFTSQTAWELGSALRTKLQAFPSPVLIEITLAQGQHCVFRAATHSGTSPDHDDWVARKRATVTRFGTSTWHLHHKFKGDAKAFAERYQLGPRAGDYAIHGGGWPLRVRGVEGVVAVVVVSGLKQAQDHGVIVQVVAEMLEGMGAAGLAGEGEKKKTA